VGARAHGACFINIYGEQTICIKRRICIRVSKNFTWGMQPRGNPRIGRKRERGGLFLATRVRLSSCVRAYLNALIARMHYRLTVTSVASLIDIIVALRRRERITGDGYSYGILMKAITGEYMPLISRLRLRTRCKKPRIASGKRRARAKRGRERERDRSQSNMEFYEFSNFL